MGPNFLVLPRKKIILTPQEIRDPLVVAIFSLLILWLPFEVMKLCPETTSRLMNHLANNGPLSVAVAASPWSFYGGGVFDGCDYDKNIEINHAVQLVGYGTDASEGDYWIIRNSWGPNWGENGFMRLKRESTAVCGTDDTPLMGTGCVDDGNDVLHVCGQCGVLFDVCYPIGADYIEPMNN